MSLPAHQALNQLLKASNQIKRNQIKAIDLRNQSSSNQENKIQAKTFRL